MQHFLARTVLIGVALATGSPALAEPAASPTDVPAEIRPLARCDVLYPAFVNRSLWQANLWPSGVVPYQFDANTSTSNQEAMRVAMDVLESVCNVAFIPRTAEPNYLHIQDAGVNSSFIGMIGGEQVVNIFNWNFTFIMAHELMHALGVFHEHTRPDRDSYITVNASVIQSNFAHNFEIAAGAEVIGPYDFESIMHYSACAFSVCCPTGSSCACPPACAPIVTLPAYSSFQQVIGSLSRLSEGDIVGLQAKYGAVGWEIADAITFNPWPFPNDLVTVPDPTVVPLGVKFGDPPSFGFLLTTRTGYHYLDNAPLNDLAPGSQLAAEYARFVNALFANPGAIRNIAIADAESLDSGGGVTPSTIWLPSATPKRVRVAPITVEP